MEITSDRVLSLVQKAFESSINNRENIRENSKRSSYFVSQLAKLFAKLADGEALVQETDKYGERIPGEWLLDIAIVLKREIHTSYKERKSTIVDKIIWAIESEFSTNIHEFCKDFSKLIHIKSEAYLYIAGLNQIRLESRQDYIKAQVKLAKLLVERHTIQEPFYIVFVPTPGKSGKHTSLWDAFEPDELASWLCIEDLSCKS